MPATSLQSCTGAPAAPGVCSQRMDPINLDHARFFASRRRRLQRIAYRMLGSVAEAEDVVQDAYLRWHNADREAVVEPEAYLVRTVTRLCLDVLKSARVQRERKPELSHRERMVERRRRQLARRPGFSPNVNMRR